jgi:hypothetical protein
MNRLLADAVGFINGFLAICIIAVGTLAGGIAVGAGGALLGFVAGSIVAIVACGLLAVAVDIRNTLHSIENQLARQTGRPST